MTNNRNDNVNTRNLVVDILLAVTRDGEFSHIAIRDVLDKYRYLPKQDRAFITRLSPGNLRAHDRAGCHHQPVFQNKSKKDEAGDRSQSCEAVSYQLKYMDSVPDSACLQRSRESLTVKRGFGGLKGFVNGVMRNDCPESWTRFVTAGCGQRAGTVSVRAQYSVPEWLGAAFYQNNTEKKPVKQSLEALFTCRIRPRCRWIQIGSSVEEITASLQAAGNYRDTE
ncbi:MAG: transcription antitermination factor NusB [Eubacterium ramulus]